MNESIRRIAIDPGFGGYKLAEVTEDKLVSYTIPSVVGMGKAEDLAGASSLDGKGHSRPVEVAFLNGSNEAVECLVGDNVELYVPPIERTDFDMLTGNWEQRALVYAALYKMLGVDESRVQVIVGLPIQVLEGKDARATVRRLSKWLEGEHDFRVNGRRATVTVEQALPAPQPLGAFFAWGLNDDGLWARDPKDLERRVGVIDVGFNTLDLLSMEGGKPVQRFTGGNQLGMSRAASRLSNEIQRRYGRHLSLHEADSLIRDYLKDKQAETVAGGRVVDVKVLVKRVLDQWAGEIVGYLGEVWGADPGFAATLVTGGGALAIGKKLHAKWQNVTVLKDPVTANARGLARYALRDALWK